MSDPITPTPGQAATLASLAGVRDAWVDTGVRTGYVVVPVEDDEERPWRARWTVATPAGGIEVDEWPPLGDGEEPGAAPTTGQAAWMAELVINGAAGELTGVRIVGTRDSYELVDYPADARRPWRARWKILGDDGKVGYVDEWPAMSTAEQDAADAAWTSDAEAAQAAADATSDAQAAAEFAAKAVTPEMFAAYRRAQLATEAALVDEDTSHWDAVDALQAQIDELRALIAP